MRIALSQFVSVPEPANNLETIPRQAEEASNAGAGVVVFPEASMACFGTPLGPVAEPLDGPWAGAVRAVAEQARVPWSPECSPWDRTEGCATPY